jgi:hypothetical protein
MNLHLQEGPSLQSLVSVHQKFLLVRQVLKVDLQARKQLSRFKKHQLS